MLLESTYFALTNSFRAILSVADNIGRLRSTIGQLLSTFALIRVMKWIYKKILFTLGRFGFLYNQNFYLYLDNLLSFNNYSISRSSNAKCCRRRLVAAISVTINKRRTNTDNSDERKDFSLDEYFTPRRVCRYSISNSQDNK